MSEDRNTVMEIVWKIIVINFVGLAAVLWLQRLLG